MVKRLIRIRNRINGKILSALEGNLTPVVKDGEEPKDDYMANEESVKDHFFTFQQHIELFTLLYTSLLFKWVNTDRVLILVDDTKVGYTLEIFLRNFRMNSIMLDKELPMNTNKHYAKSFTRGNFNISICMNKFNESSPDFARELVNDVPVPTTIIFFELFDNELLEYYCFHPNVRSIHHFLSKLKKVKLF